MGGERVLRIEKLMSHFRSLSGGSVFRSRGWGSLLALHWVEVKVERVADSWGRNRRCV